MLVCPTPSISAKGDRGLGVGSYWQHTRPDAPSPQGPSSLPGRLWDAPGGWVTSSLLVVPSPKICPAMLSALLSPPSPYSASSDSDKGPWGVRETPEDPRPGAEKIKTKFQS